MAIYSAPKMNPKTGATTRVIAPKSAPSKNTSTISSQKKPLSSPVSTPQKSADVSINPVRPGSYSKKVSSSTPAKTATPVVAPRQVVTTPVAPHAQGNAYVPSSPGNQNRKQLAQPRPQAPTAALAPQADRRAPVVQNKGLEDAALSDALKSFNEGGANFGVPAGTDVNTKMESDPGFRKLLQEQIYQRAYGTGRPTFATPEPATPEAVAGSAEIQAPQGDVADIMGRFGLAPRYDLSAPDAQTDTVAPEAELTGTYDKQIEELANAQFDTSAAQTAYEAKLADIQARYTAQREAARRSAENQASERFSNLAGVGFNPLSSGGNALENEKNQLIAQYNQQISQQQAQEESMAAAEFSAAQQAASEGRMRYLQDARDAVIKREETSYNRGRNTIADSIAVLNATLNAQEKNRLLSDTERDNTVSSFKTVLDELGSSAFDGLGDADLRSFESALGLPAGALRGALASFKAAELKAAETKNRPELRDVGGNLYQMTFDSATGAWVPSLILAKPVSRSGGGGGRVVQLPGGGEVTSDIREAALKDYAKAYGDSSGSITNVSRADEDNIVSTYILLGGNGSNEVLSQNRADATQNVASAKDNTADRLNAILGAFE